MSQIEQRDLATAIVDIRQITQDLGLDPYPTHFELVPPDMMYEMAAYGIPGRYTHWTNGSEYYKQKTRGKLGEGKIYELVINTNPSYAFIQDSNALIEAKLTVGHVLAHTDFFKNNAAFSRSNTNMLDTADLQGERLRNYSFEHGDMEVERLLDSAKSIEFCIEPGGDPRKWTNAQSYTDFERQQHEDDRKRKDKPSTAYDDLFEIGEKKPEPTRERPKFPIREEMNLLKFIALHSPGLEEWQRDAVMIVHDQAQYFYPQWKTKIMNEGWATLWHVRILQEYGNRGGLTDGEAIDWARLHSSVAVPIPQEINPYYVGLEIWKDIERRFKGEPVYDKEGKVKKEKDWNGDEIDPERFRGNFQFDIFDARSNTPTDQDFLGNFLTPSLIDRLGMYSYGFNGQDWVIEDKTPKKVYDGIVHSMTNSGMPLLVIPPGGADYNSRGELYITHKSEGDGMEPDSTRALIPHLYRLWGKPVHLEATMQDIEEVGNPWERRAELKTYKVLLTCEDGNKVEVKKL